MTNIFIHRDGRQYLKLPPNENYALPVDIEELHRQALRTLMLIKIHGAPFCAPFFKNGPPSRVLDLRCGNGYWSAACYEYFKSIGHTNISFTGLDVAALAPDYQEQGIDWTFVQQNANELPLPFPDGSFDFVFVKDGDFASTISNSIVPGDTDAVEPQVREMLRLLKPGGVMEVWESDWLFRALLPHPSIPPGTPEEHIKQAERSSTYLIGPSTAFASVQNKYLADCNAWMELVGQKTQMSLSPCAMTSWTLSSEPDLKNYGSRRVAIPFGEIRWESVEDEADHPSLKGRGGHNRASHTRAAEKQVSRERVQLTPAQAALRRTALTTSIQFLESLELELKAESGKRQDEWDRWWAAMMQNLLEENGTFEGECLEIGAWWVQKAED